MASAVSFVLVLCLSAQAQAASHKSTEKSVFLHAGGKSNAHWEPPWEDTAHHASTRLQCGVTEQVGAHTDKYEDCPSECPYFAQNRKDAAHCTFLCVPGAECGKWNPNKPIPDSIKNTKTCRGPKVAFCDQPKLDGSDNCDVCMSGYKLHHDDGQCYFEHWTAIIIGLVVFVVIFVVVIGWVTDMCCRAPVNEEWVDRAQAWRSRSKILDAETHTVYDWSKINLCNQDVAGPGMLLHFRFQRFFIIWPFCVACVWVAFALFHNELFILGTRKFGTPRHNCILVAWGYETQQRLMWTKVAFLAIVYVGSFISFLWFSVVQQKKYDEMDVAENTMKDFALEIHGVPELPGDKPKVEEDFQAALESALNVPKGHLVGVSLAWNYGGDTGFEDHVNRACNRDLIWRQTEWELEEKSGKEGAVAASEVAKKIEAEKQKGETEPEYSGLRKTMYGLEKSVLGPDDEILCERDDKGEPTDKDWDKEEKKDAYVVDMLKKLKTADVAFLIFKTEDDKKDCLNNWRGKPINITLGKDYDGVKVETMEVAEVYNEPMNVNWHNFGDSDPNKMILGFFKGFFKVYVPALLIWFFCFYVPYAWSLYNFNYDNGAELPGYYSLIFTIVVCGGNATMYVVCDVCCDIIGFRYKDTKQMTYMLMYLAACMINVFLDMVVTYYTALKVMVGLDFRTYHGERLAEIDVFTEQFETYAMQRSLGENTYRYAWPSTFFLCFVLEPFVTIFFPYQIGKLIIKSHTEIRGATAEAYLMAFEFDMGRYADILLNVFLGILIFYFPGGYIWGLFFAMCFSHCFIYCFDHWRVVSVIPTIKIVSPLVDWWAQVMMCGCCAVILSCLVFKANCETYSGYCMQEFKLVSACAIAGTIHFLVHFALLVYLVPKLCSKDESSAEKNSPEGPPEQYDEKGTFEDAATNESRTWFSVNPVHCLRSKYIRKESPPCHLAAYGKEHLLQPNKKINCHFEMAAAQVEEFGASALFRKSMAVVLKKKDEPEPEQK